MKNALFIALGVFTVSYLAIWLSAISRGDGHRRQKPGPLDAGIGFFTNFLDTLGIGSFATTSSLFKLCSLVPDEQIPGTLNVGHTLPTVTEAFIYVGLVQVDPTTLIALIAASAVGAWLGAGVVSHWPRRKVQIGMGSVLVAAACLMLMSLFHWGPGGGNAMGLTGPKLAAFPIMMGSCAFLMPVGSARFIRSGSYNLKSALGLAIGGIPGVLIAAFIVKSLPLEAVKWLVIGVVLYTSFMMLRSAHVERGTRLAEAHADLPADATAEASAE